MPPLPTRIVPTSLTLIQRALLAPLLRITQRNHMQRVSMTLVRVFVAYVSRPSCNRSRRLPGGRSLGVHAALSTLGALQTRMNIHHAARHDDPHARDSLSATARAALMPYARRRLVEFPALMQTLLATDRDAPQRPRRCSQLLDRRSPCSRLVLLRQVLFTGLTVHRISGSPCCPTLGHSPSSRRITVILDIGHMPCSRLSLLTLVTLGTQ